MRTPRVALALFVAAASIAVQAAAQSPLPPTATPAEVATYEAFRAWITQQPVAVQNADDEVVYQRYAAELRAQKKSEPDITATIASLKSIGDRAEIERWNRILTAPAPRFNTAPNAFLVSVTAGVKPDDRWTSAWGRGATRSTWRRRVGTRRDSIPPIAPWRPPRSRPRSWA
jgi:hypothetical protein